METIINIIQLISDYRFWLLPILLICTVVILAVEIRDVFRNIREEMEDKG